MTAREQFELEHFNIQPAKVGRRYHAASALPLMTWRRSLKGWVLLALGWVLGTLFGVMLVLAWEITK